MSSVPISAIIIGDNLDQTNKYKFLEIIKKDSFSSSIPVIVSIDRKNIDEESYWIKAGAIDYIAYPYNQLLILERIKNVITLTENTKALEDLEYDELTGLLTRQAFIHHARYYIGRDLSKSYCIVALDVENFKLTNTLYGEDRCNEFLAFVAKKLLGILRSDGIAGRFGGDQFVVLFEPTTDITAEVIHQYVTNVLSKTSIPKQIIKVGVYQPIDTKLPIVRCCDKAFLAIREIKGVYGKNIVFYEDKFQQQLLNEKRITESMEKALAEKQFKVYYQPKHESVTGKIAGAEALIRWEHPEYGFMSPGQFIPVFEKNGFITKIDKFVVEKVCSEIKDWQEKGIPVVPVSINISRRDFFEEHWIDHLIQIIDDSGIDHSLIHMEVTESMYSENMDVIIEQVKKLQDKGYLIEMDDFGAGYSSLGMLATFPLDVIKLDISFVRHIDVNEIVIENIIKMAHRMGLITVAEGAESKEQYKILKELGCDLIQGYVFSKPLPSAEFADYLTRMACSLEPINTHLSLYSNGSYNDQLLLAASEVAEGIPGGYFSYHFDESREIITFNKEMLHIFGCETAEEFRTFTKNTFDGMVLPEDYPEVQRRTEEQISEKNHLVYADFRIRCKSGEIKFIRYYGRLVNSEKFGDVFYVFINDCTEEFLKQHAEKLRSEVIQGISQTYSSIFVLDFDTGEIIPFAIANEVSNARDILSQVTNYRDMEELYTKQFVHASDVELMRRTASIENIKKELSETNYFSFTFHLKKELNGYSLVEMAFRKLKDENRNNRVVITFRPVYADMVRNESERNKLLVMELDIKHKLQERYKFNLEKALRKGEIAEQSFTLFVDNILQNLIMNVEQITGSLSYLKENLDKPDIVKDTVNTISNQHESLSFISNRILKMNDMQKGSIKFNERPTDISSAIEKIKNVVEKDALAKNIQIETWNNVKDPYIYQDVSLTAEAVCAVIFNAIKYTPEGGKISFGLSQLPSSNKDEVIIQFCCRDNGIGISEDFIPKIFDKFTREDNEINRSIPSAGLGLTITKFIVDAQKGKIEVQSNPGKLTQVIITTSHRCSSKDEIENDEALISRVLNK